MEIPYDPSSLLVHSLRVKGLAATSSVARATGVEHDQAALLLGALQAQGLVVRRTGSVEGWALSPAGREEHARALAAAERERGSTATDAIHAWYERFLELDGQVKSVCTDWQLRDLGTGRVNDHTDPAYDRGVVERLSRIHGDAANVVDGLVGVANRFAPYRDRLDDAHRRVVAGDPDAFTAPLTDSYHDVWSELHEDLLLTLGIERHEGVT